LNGESIHCRKLLVDNGLAAKELKEHERNGTGRGILNGEF